MKGVYRPPKCRHGSDRLSELPDGVIVHILSFLPTLDAVRTVLLRRFGSLWTLVPTLDFREAQFSRESSDEETSYYCTTLKSNFALFVRNVLILHKRPTVDKFTLCFDEDICWELSDSAVAEVGMWIRFALSRDVKAMMLFFYGDDYFPLPVCIYTSQSLVMLKLRDCKIDVPSRVHMGSLRTLDISRFLVGDFFSQFVVGCPALKELAIAHTYDILDLRSPSIEKLEFIDVDGDGPCTIDCPNLKSLDISVDLYYTGVVNVPSVREVTVSCGDCFSDEDVVLRCKRFLEEFQSAEVLKFVGAVDEDLTYFLELNVGFPENRWKRVILDSSMQVACIAGIYSLVRNSPYLEELIIGAVPFQRSKAEVEIGRKLVSREASSPCVVPCLKVVSMHGYRKPYERQLQFAEFLLKSAVNLDKLIIFSNGLNKLNKLTSAEELLFVKRLSKFPRASPKAMIVFQ